MTDDGVVYAHAELSQEASETYLFFCCLTLQSLQEGDARCVKCLLAALLFISVESAC